MWLAEQKDLKDKQNEIWDRLKNASDEVYKKKKEFISNIKVSLGENLEKKTKLNMYHRE